MVYFQGYNTGFGLPHENSKIDGNLPNKKLVSREMRIKYGFGIELTGIKSRFNCTTFDNFRLEKFQGVCHPGKFNISLASLRIKLCTSWLTRYENKTIFLQSPNLDNRE